MKRFFIIAMVATALISCKSGKGTSQKKVTQNASQIEASSFMIEKNVWELTSFQGKSPEEAGFTDRIPHVVINKEKASMGGNSGCNSFSGGVEVTDYTLKLGLFMSTKMYCDGVPEIEFFKILEGELDYKVEDEKLSLTKDGQPVMEFRLKEKDQ